jgi:hypothetical protein
MGEKNTYCVNVPKLMICAMCAVEYYKILPTCPVALNPKRSMGKNICYVTEKGKVLAVHVMTAYRGRRGRAPLILKHGCSWR